MKTLTLGLLLALSFSASAYEVSLDAAKCTIFGNMKVKVSGLETLGNAANGYLKNKSTSRSNCKGEIAELRGVFAGETIYADATKTQKVRKTNISEDNEKGRDRYCREELVTTVSVNFPSYSAAVFTNTTSRHLRTYPGTCNR
ncbi:putative exported protein [Halobacteriovorax marinus SJ]|uniref:Exported protein n=1 Tax=Halobacteriovorax marinus (strain ATCC BAA-682 / DSM 15412 / SJ) TaxID=862908 RepID=E1X0C4_HALMS|nr:hypothetical protein [Halobacteriovorax marinus]CBW26352.1 putative exported protein [Halobacteriovorax marinus SJ]